MRSASLKDAFENSCSRWREKPAVTFYRQGDQETSLTYGQVDRDANQIAHTFKEAGVGKGDRVILFMEKSLVGVVAHIALQKLGAVAVPLNPGFKKAEMEYLLNDAAATLVMTDPDRESLISEIDPDLKTLTVPSLAAYQTLNFFRHFPSLAPLTDIQPDEPAVIIYTSGTTGKPKGAVLTQQNLMHDAKNIIDIWEISRDDVLCHTLPLFHIHGLCFALHTAFLTGAHTLMLDQFNPARVLKFLSRRIGGYRCTLFMAVPTMYTKIMDHLEASGGKGFDFRHLRLLTSGSAPLLSKEFERIQRLFGHEPVEREGMSETGMNFSNPIKGERKPGSIGLPLPDLEVRIVDPATFDDVAPGNTGEIWLRGPGITPGYWRNPQETQKTFADGWFRTGDLGRVDSKGYYYITDRLKHIIISGGENVSAKEVERVINAVEGVVESAVVGVPDEKWGETVTAAVVLKPGVRLTPESIQSHCRQKLHKWKSPKKVLFVDELPRNSMGKILNEEVKKLFYLASPAGIDFSSDQGFI
jgi:malonyl-CoA/methylmalonyl-CoA synthetase